MADISKYISLIESAIHGDDIRQAIIQAIEVINQGTTVQRLNGMLATVFVTKDDFDKVAPLLSYIDSESEKGVQSQAIYSKITELINTIDRNINKKEPEHSTIYDAIADAITSINDIREAIMRKEVSLSKDAPLSRYETAIKSIYLGAETVDLYDFQSLDATENKTYYSGKNSDNKDIAYRTVNVNVEPTVMAKSVTKLSSTSEDFIASSEQKIQNKEVDGYSSFEINISSQVPELNVSSEELPTKLDSVKNLEFAAKDVAINGNNALGFSKVTVDLRNKIDSLNIEINPDESLLEDTYTAEDGDGVGSPLYGYDKVTISIMAGDGPFTVYFRDDDDTLLDTVENVSKHSFAVYDGPDPTKDGYSFSGWNPLPVDVTSDITCYATYQEETNSGGDNPGGNSENGISIDGNNNIRSDWDTIGKVSGNDIPVGATKTVFVDTCTFTYNGGGLQFVIPAWSYKMIYVGLHYGLKTWVSKNSIPVELPFDDIMGFPRLWVGGQPDLVKIRAKNGWNTCRLRENLNGPFFNAFSDGPGFPSSKPEIQSRECTHYAYTPAVSTESSSSLRYIDGSHDYIWLLSVQERNGGSDEGGDTFKIGSDLIQSKIDNTMTRTVTNGYYSYVESYVDSSGVSKLRRVGNAYLGRTTPSSDDLNQMGFTDGDIYSAAIISTSWVIGGDDERTETYDNGRLYYGSSNYLVYPVCFGFCTP